MKRSLFAATLFFATLVVGQAQPASELRYAVIVTRHGVRSPTWKPGLLNQYSNSPWPDFGVPPGHLTLHGRTLMKMMGGYYRDVFTRADSRAKSDCSKSRSVYFWADTDQRTMETAEAMAEGMFPGCAAEGQVHSMPAGKSDPLFDPIEAGVARQDARLGLAAVNGRIGPTLDVLVKSNRPAFDTLQRVLNGNGKTALSIFDEPAALTAGRKGVAMSGPLRLASTLAENLMLEFTNGMSGEQLGWGRLNASNLQQVMALHAAYADLMRKTPYLARTRGSNLLSHVLRSLEQAVEYKPIKGALGAPETELLVISGHDTNISNLAGMLGLSWLLPSYQRDDVPPGGALIFSLWRLMGTSRYSVRVQFIAQTLDQMHDSVVPSAGNLPPGADLFVPGCSTSGEGFACNWTDFLQTATSTLLP